MYVESVYKYIHDFRCTVDSAICLAMKIGFKRSLKLCIAYVLQNLQFASSTTFTAMCANTLAGQDVHPQPRRAW
jgi:hypothetical protein